MLVGKAIRDYRAKKGLSLRRVAREAGISSPTLSQIENNKSSPNLVTLKKIADVLEVSVIAILASDQKNAVSLVRKKERERFTRHSSSRGSITEEFLVERRDVKMEAASISLPPGAERSDFMDHEGEELAMVLQGSVEIILEGVGSYLLEEGDTLYYPCSIPHSFRNALEDGESVFIFVATPPNF
ncbi:MAG: helix-turn-helix domain-containing protein [Spirochaetia bacterium]